MGVKWRTKRHKPGTFFNVQRIARATVSPLFTCPGFTLDMVCAGIMHCVDLGPSKRCESLWGGKLKDWYKENNPHKPDTDFGYHQIQKG